MAMNRKTKGKSINVVRVTDVKKSRRVSNSRKWLAMAPADCGRADIFMPMTCSNMRLAIRVSAERPAASAK